jgi:MurNAc alpha-1-phosphate uridylyltransferase
MIRTAFLLAAGLGTRLRPLTLTTPKPLVKVGGVPMLERAILALEAVGVEKIIINMHYLPEQIAAFVAARQQGQAKLILSDECEMLLDSGGGVQKALPLLDDAFYVLNADTFFIDRQENTLQSLAQNWQGEGAGMLLATKAQSIGFTGKGDFTWHDDETLTRGGELIYAGAHILHKTAFDHAPQAPFSLNAIWNQVKLTGQVFNGTWYHIGDEASLNEANARLT